MNRPTKLAIANQIEFIASVANYGDSAHDIAQKTGLSIYIVERRVALAKRKLVRGEYIQATRTNAGRIVGIFRSCFL